MLRCGESEIYLQNKKLEGALSKAQRLIADNLLTRGSISAERLQASQAAWLKYREDYCTTVGLATSGPNEWSALHANNCITELGNARLKELQTLAGLLAGE